MFYTILWLWGCNKSHFLSEILRIYTMLSYQIISWGESPSFISLYSLNIISVSCHVSVCYVTFSIHISHQYDNRQFTVYDFIVNCYDPMQWPAFWCLESAVFTMIHRLSSWLEASTKEVTPIACSTSSAQAVQSPPAAKACFQSQFCTTVLHESIGSVTLAALQYLSLAPCNNVPEMYSPTFPD